MRLAPMNGRFRLRRDANLRPGEVYDCSKRSPRWWIGNPVVLPSQLINRPWPPSNSDLWAIKSAHSIDLEVAYTDQTCNCEICLPPAPCIE